MNKKIIYSLPLLCLLCCQTIHAATNALFQVDTNDSVLTIHTVTPNHSYANAGIKIDTSGYSLANIGVECQLSGNGYCLFPVSDTTPATITLAGPVGNVSFTLCLNGKGPVSCQHYSTNITATQNFVLNGVSCDSNGQKCTIVGEIEEGLNTSLVLSYFTTNGGVSWTLNPTPSVPQNSISTSLFSISCMNNGLNCKAVGYYSDNAQNLYPLSYSTLDAGVTWTLHNTPPLPNDAAQVQYSAFNHISCGNDTVNDAQNCVAVGTYTGPITFNSFVDHTTNGGATWTNTVLTQPGDISNLDPFSDLLGVSCSSSGLICTAVGFYTNYNTHAALYSYSTTNGGQTWSAPNTAFTLPADAADTQNTLQIYPLVLSGITCTSDGQNCIAVGNYYNNLNQIKPLSYETSNAGTTWTLNPTPAVPNDFLSFAALNDVSCDNAGTTCTAVGEYVNQQGLYIPLSYRTTLWTLNPTPTLPSTPVQPQQIEITGLSSISCGSTGLSCITVGDYLKAEADDSALAYYTLNGGVSWTLSVPLAP